MKSLRFFFLVFSLGTYVTFSQVMDLENVTLQQLNQMKHQIDDSAPAAILFKRAKTKFKFTPENGYHAVTEFNVKIKIFKKEGLKWANFKIPFFIGYESIHDDLINVVKAYTYNSVNGQILKERVSEIGQIEENVNDFWKVTTIFFPNVKEGSIIELKYILESQNIGVLPEFQFQYDIPVDFAEYITEVPEFYLYKGMKTGNIPIEMKEIIEEDIANNNDKYDTSKGLSHKNIKTTYTVRNVPSLIEESFVSNFNNYFGKIEHELQTIRMPFKKPVQISKTWKDVALSIYGLKRFGDQIERQSYYKDDLKKVIVGSDSDSDKLNKIFAFLQDRMHWNNRKAYLPRKSLEEVYKEKKGNSAEINLILISMLRTSGLVANPVLLSTKDNGIVLFPNSSKINYVIAAVDIGANRFLLDATSKYGWANVIPFDNLNWKGVLMKKDGECTEIDVMPKVVSKLNTNIIGALSVEGILSGKIKKTYFDYHALSFRQSIDQYSIESIVSKLENDFKGVYIDDYKLENRLELNKPIVEFYAFKKDGQSEIIRDKIYFSPLEFMEENTNPFLLDKRIYPIDFIFPSHKKKGITIDLPKEYVIESMPSSVTIKFKENLLVYNFDIVAIGNQIQISTIFEINTSLIAPEDYKDLKEFYAEVIKKQTEKIVLKKV